MVSLVGGRNAAARHARFASAVVGHRPSLRVAAHPVGLRHIGVGVGLCGRDVGLWRAQPVEEIRLRDGPVAIKV